MTAYYISGPMAGYPEYNFPAFQAAQEWCENAGLTVLSPHAIQPADAVEWADFLRSDLAQMLAQCNGLILLPGWPQSKGARLELATAVALDWPVLYFTGDSLIDMNKGADSASAIDVAHLERQRRWSEATFGPGPRTLGVIEHIREELEEVEAAPDDLTEWADVVILALDGAWRAGYSPAQIIAAIKIKQTENERRIWPDWRNASPDHKIKALDPGCVVCGRDNRNKTHTALELTGRLGHPFTAKAAS